MGPKGAAYTPKLGDSMCHSLQLLGSSEDIILVHLHLLQTAQELKTFHRILHGKQ